MQVHVAQLSSKAVAFLSNCFRARTEEGGTVSIASLLTNTAGALFHSAPRPPLDENLVRGCMTNTGRPGWLTLDGYLALWAYCTLIDPRQAVKAMLYAGFPDDLYSCALSLLTSNMNSERSHIPG